MRSPWCPDTLWAALPGPWRVIPQVSQVSNCLSSNHSASTITNLVKQWDGMLRYDGTRVADPHHCNADPDRAFHFNADPYRTFDFHFSYFQPPGFHNERSRYFKVPFGASKAYEFSSLLIRIRNPGWYCDVPVSYPIFLTHNDKNTNNIPTNLMSCDVFTFLWPEYRPASRHPCWRDLHASPVPARHTAHVTRYTFQTIYKFWIDSNSVADPWNSGADSDPRIRTSD
jgi:hypothetical protein